MARTAKEPAENPVPAPQVEETDDEFTPDDVAMENIVNTLIDEEQSCVRIFRVGKHGKDLTFIDEIAPTDFQLGMLKHPPYNGGTFRVYGIVNGKIAGSRILKVDAPIIVEQKSGSGDVAAVLAAIQEQGRQTQQAIELAFKALASASQPKQESKTEWLQELVVLKGLFDRPAQPAQNNGIDGSLALLKQILEVKSMLGEGGDSTSPLLTVGMKLLEKMPNIADMQRQPAPETPPQLQAQTVMPQYIQPNPAPIIQPVNMEPENMNDSMMMELLIKAAETKASISWWSDKVAENLPEELWDKLPQENWFDELQKVEPRIAAHREWITEVRNKILRDYDLTIPVEGGTNDESKPDSPQNDPKQSA